MKDRYHKGLCRKPKTSVTTEEDIHQWQADNADKDQAPRLPPRADLAFRSVAKGSLEHKKRCAQAKKDYYAALRRLNGKQK